MAKKNCWEHKNCGRQPAGAKAAELGECVAAKIKAHDGIHGGVNRWQVMLGCGRHAVRRQSIGYFRDENSELHGM